MLEIKSIAWKNFLSYGDYVTTLELDTLGQCLITGEVLEEGKDSSRDVAIKKSNGAGKSTIPNVIQWTLFGRTMHSRAPGNNIVNWFTGKDCWAQIIFKNGDSITRTRNINGHNELLYIKDGDEERLLADTLSTTAAQQAKLNKVFDLDWEIFCGSVFFNQYGKPWMEMAETTRKKAIERILHVDRLTYYANAAKTKCSDLDIIVDRFKVKVDSGESNLNRLNEELERVKDTSATYNDNKIERLKKVRLRIDEEIKRRDETVLPDITALKEKWDIISKIEQRILDLKKNNNANVSEMSRLNGKRDNFLETVKAWKSKAGKICTSCEQSIDSTHVDKKSGSIESKIAEVNDEIKKVRDSYEALADGIKKAEELLKAKKPSITLEEAKNIHSRWKQYDNEIKRLEKEYETIETEINPHDKSIKDIEQRIIKTKKEVEEAKSESVRSVMLNKHYHYIHKAYNDRTKIKNSIFREHVPFINSRLKYYLDIFELDIKIELTEALGITSSAWGYEFESGGERKRTDVAFMLAMFDFHEQMYGRQCNILVMDEVDGRLDDDGIESLIEIIKNDLTHRVETIMIISHRNMMFDTFPHELRVTRKDRMSTLEVL